MISQMALVMESAIFVVTKQRRPDHWKRVTLEQLQTLIESIVDINLPIPSDDGYPSRPAEVSYDHMK